MSPFLLMLLPLWVVTVNKRIQQIKGSIAEGNRSKLKADVFFLFLILLVSAALVFFLHDKKE